MGGSRCGVEPQQAFKFLDRFINRILCDEKLPQQVISIRIVVIDRYGFPIRLFSFGIVLIGEIDLSQNVVKASLLRELLNLPVDSLDGLVRFVLLHIQRGKCREWLSTSGVESKCRVQLSFGFY